MGVQVNNVCYTEQNQALSTINAKFPIFDTSQDKYLVSSSLDLTTGLYQYTTKNSLGTVLQTNAQVYYPTCTQQTITHDGLIVTLAFWFACLLGAICGYNLTGSTPKVNI